MKIHVAVFFENPQILAHNSQWEKEKYTLWSYDFTFLYSSPSTVFTLLKVESYKSSCCQMAVNFLIVVSGEAAAHKL